MKLNFEGLKRLITRQNTASARLRLKFVDEAMKTAYNESLYDEGYAWLVETIKACKSLEEVKAELTDANFHDAVKALP
ncbi:hypothetical protein F4Z98_05875 [Candidatus Poribacteria bacterium]|nr:hypothetical protein [Candidatus Poribacteria bacterium]MYB01793.1 hypothetical protein [Candidatus Poribacteria bacterium]